MLAQSFFFVVVFYFCHEIAIRQKMLSHRQFKRSLWNCVPLTDYIYILHSECLLSSLALYLCGKQVCWEATLSDNDALLWHFICKMRWLWKTEQPIHTHYTFVFVFLTKHQLHILHLKHFTYLLSAPQSPEQIQILFDSIPLWS